MIRYQGGPQTPAVRGQKGFGRRRRPPLIGMLLFLLGLTLMGGAPSEPGRAFSIVVMPDTQGYTKLKTHHKRYYNQARWIAANKKKYNIQLVIHLGDLTNGNTSAEWKVADAAHKILEEAKIPYTVVPGNHDVYESKDTRALDPPRNYRYYREYFPASRFGAVPWIAGCDACSENNYRLFDAGGLEFLVLNLEVAPSKDAVCWANGVIAKYPFRRIILVTHCYQAHGGNYCGNCDERPHLIGADGKELWKEFAGRHSNMFMVLSGHLNGSIHKAVKGVYGNTVHQVLTDFQDEGDGNGWLRILTFQPRGKGRGRVVSKVISSEGYARMDTKGWGPGGPKPGKYFPADPADPQHRFSFNYDMTKPAANRFDNRHIGFSDRLVNTSGAGNQVKPGVAMDKPGNFVVVWEDDRDGRGPHQIHARGFFAGGCARFSTVIGPAGEGHCKNPVIAMEPGGRFVTAWEEHQTIYVQGFRADGSEHFPPRKTAVTTGGQQAEPAVAMDERGNFVVAWEASKGGKNSSRIYVGGFNADGRERFGKKTVAGGAEKRQRRPSVGMDAKGNFVIAWEDDRDGDGIYRVYAAGFRANGNRRFEDIVVDGKGAGQESRPVVAMDEAGDFVVVWQGDRNYDGVYEIYARGFKVNGRKRFPRMTVNSQSRGQQRKPAAAMDAKGNVLIAWEDDVDEEDGYQIYARGLNRDGVPLYRDRLINSDGKGLQTRPAVAINSKGYAVVVWEDYLHLDRGHGAEILVRHAARGPSR